MVAEVVYCERVPYLEWVQGEFADNFFTVDGRVNAHRRVEDKQQVGKQPAEERPWEARSVWLSSERLKLTAKCDVVTGKEGRVAVVEYKRGKRPPVPEGARLPQRVQLCAQVLLLREHGYDCDEAWIWYVAGREKVAITIDDPLIEMTHAAIARVREVTAQPTPPPPLVNDRKCRGCSLAGICLPDELQLLKDAERKPSNDTSTEPRPHVPLPVAPVKLRRLYSADDQKSPLYVQEQGATVGVTKNRLYVKTKDGERTEVRLPHTSQVCLFGNVQVSTQAVRTLLMRGIPIAYFTTGGWYAGRTLTHDTNNVDLRIAQYAAASDELWRLQLSRALIENKILNQRTLLRRNHSQPDPVALKELKHLSRKALDADARASLLGIEGTAARVYFRELPGAFKGKATVTDTFDYQGRNRRPPRDPLNALLSLTYALLTKEWSVTLQLVGLDPLLGFLHEPRFGRPALALDLMEPFRPIISDSVVLGLINNGEVDERDFITGATGCALTKYGRKKVLAAYERRLAQEVKHPVFGYRISYRRVIEVQARLLARHLTGEIEAYPSFRTR
ncbi:MAG: CRISPR-associated endonuclease Cas1 [Myxococcota bacterium]